MNIRFGGDSIKLIFYRIEHLLLLFPPIDLISSRITESMMSPHTSEPELVQLSWEVFRLVWKQCFWLLTEDGIEVGPDDAHQELVLFVFPNIPPNWFGCPNCDWFLKLFPAGDQQFLLLLLLLNWFVFQVLVFDQMFVLFMMFCCCCCWYD